MTITYTQFRKCETGIFPLLLPCVHHDGYNLTTYCSSYSSFDGDQFLLFYRRDLQEKDGWDVPKTWDELVDVAG